VAGSEQDDRARFEALVADAMDGLPDWVHERLENVDVVVEDDPPEDNLNLLGLYEGIPLTKRGMHYTWALPDRITLYRRTIEGAAGHDPNAVRRVVAHTVVHEIAHFFGISDERLRELGRD
jgi:predicted Zn-dependent protease with MMP-like domain